MCDDERRKKEELTAHTGSGAPVGAALPMFKPRPTARAAKAVGNYALQIDFSDGHTTGIYSYDYLRTICPCEECAKAFRSYSISAILRNQKRLLCQRAIIAAETRPLSTKMLPVANNIHPAHSNGAHARESMIRPARRAIHRRFWSPAVPHCPRLGARGAMFPSPKE